MCSLLASSMDSLSAELDCLVRPEMFVELSSPVDTTLKGIMVKIGEQIVTGQPLVQLENSVEAAKVELAKQQVQSTAELENKQVQLTFAKRNLIRIEDLHKKKSVSLFEKDKAETEVRLAEIELQQAKEKKRIAELALKQAEVELALRTIRSPVDGIVVDIYAHAGESVAERTIMKLAQIDPLRVELIAPTQYFGLIEAGMEVEIVPEYPHGKTYQAKVTVVDQLIDPASGSFTVRMSLPNPDDELVGGVNCIARFDFKAPAARSHGVYGSLNR